MKTTHLFLSFFVLSILFTACSSDDDNSQQPEETTQLDPVITGAKITYLGVPEDPNASVVKAINTTTINDNKKQLMVREFFRDDISYGFTTQEVYEFNASGTVAVFTREEVNGQIVREYFYDNQQRLVGANLGAETPYRYFRFPHISENISYFEEISLPYNDPNTEVRRRYILEFDENDNIIKAGKDFDFDGNMDGVNSFQYNNNNLISGQMASGENFTVAYSSIIDTEEYLLDKTFGKKMNRILCGELFGGTSTHYFKEGAKSFNVTHEESQQNTFETLSNNFYFKKIVTVNGNPNLEESYTTEFTFQ